MPINQSSISNRLLTLLSVSDYALLRPHLEPVLLPLRRVLVAANEQIEHAYFLDSGIASVVAIREDNSSIEAGIYGREGVGGFAVLLGSDKAPHEHFMQVAGEGHRIKSADLQRAVQKSPALQTLLLRFVHVFVAQSAQTTLANGLSNLDERLARWLLMCNDRIDGDEIIITHQFLSIMLGVRRSGVTDTIHILEGRGLIRAARGKITIRDRAKLERHAGTSYGLPEAEYRRLIGPF